jgi:hypothetical protein
LHTTGLPLDEIQAKNSMRAGGFGVDGGGIGLANGGAEVQGPDQIIKAVNIDLMEACEKDAPFGIFAN